MNTANRPDRDWAPAAPRPSPRFGVFVGVMLCLQAGAIVLVAWYMAHREAVGGLPGMGDLLLWPMLVFVFPLLGIAGLVPAIVFFQRNTVPASVLLATSLAMCTLVLPGLAVGSLSPHFSAAARQRLAESAEEGDRAYSQAVPIHPRSDDRPSCAEIGGSCADAFSGYASGISIRAESARGRARSDRLVEAAAVRARWPGGPRVFATPDEAARVLIDTVTTNDVEPLRAIFGSPARASALVYTRPPALGLPEVADLAGPRRNREVFVRAAAENWRWEDVGRTRKELVVGNEAWPFPVPLVKGAGGWSFDPEAGREELLNREIGRNELAVIGVLKDYVAAQAAYAATGHDGKPAGRYARRLESDKGRQNGLYWPSWHGPPRSPLELLVAQAGGRGAPPTSHHGYHFRILEGQGSSAPGGAADYVVDGEMTGGFAFVAWPHVHPAGQRNHLSGSGIVTFIVNRDGVIYEKDLGSETTTAVKEITLYDPDGTWVPVQPTVTAKTALTTGGSRRP